MILIEENWEGFRNKYINKVLECDSHTEQELLDEKMKDYIFQNDDFRNSILRNIANSNSSKLRNYYFNQENVELLIDNDKLGWVIDSGPFFPNKVQLLDKDYILDEIASYKYHYMGRIIKYIMNDSQGETIIDNLLSYYTKDIMTYKNALEGIFGVLTESEYEHFIMKYKNTFIKYSQNNEKFSFDFLFSEFRNFELLFKTVNLFEENENIFYSPAIVKQIIKNLSFFGETDNDDYLKCKDTIYNYLMKETVKKNYLNIVDGYSSINSIITNFGMEIVKYYFDFSGTMFLKETGRLSYLLKSDVDLNNLFSTDCLAIILDNRDLEEFHKTLNIIKNQDIGIAKLLNKYLEMRNYEAFYALFSYLSDKDQLKWFSDEENEKILTEHLEISPILYKGMKKSLYYNYDEYFHYVGNDLFSTYELDKIIENADDYSESQLEIILTNKSNMRKILESAYFTRNFVKILNLNIEAITKSYLDKGFQKEILSQHRLTDIYSGINYYYPLNFNKERFFSIEENLEEIGKKTSEEYDRNRYYDAFFANYKYKYFFYYIEKLTDKDSVYKILDFFLNNPKYLKAFQLATKYIDRDLLKQYYKEREALITEVVNTGDLELIDNIFLNLDSEQLSKEITKDRERVIYSLTDKSLYQIFVEKLNNSYKLYENTLDFDKFVSIFRGHDFYLKYKYLDGILPEGKFRDKLLEKVNEHNDIILDTLKRLGDTYDEFLVYLRIINNSSFKDSLDKRDQEFLKDLKGVLLKRDYFAAFEFKDKYKNVDIEKIKLEILEEIKRKSRMSILSSLTDLNKYKSEIQTYKLRNKTYKIPTIVFDGEPYNFLIRRMDSGKHLNTKDNAGKAECFSTIYEENRSTFYGDTGVKFGYSNVIPEDITYIFPFDAISNNFSKQKYYPGGLKTPAWLSADDLNRITKNNKCYNELRIEGIHEPDFVLSYDEPNDGTIAYAGSNNSLMVKILRKSYPNSIEYNEDPYHNVK